MKNSASKYSSFILSGVILLLLLTAYFTLPGFKDFVDTTVRVLTNGNTEITRAYFKDFGVWGPVAIILFIILQMFLIIFPSWIPIIVAVMAYGVWWGSLISLTGVVLASYIGYFIGEKLKGVFLTKIFGEDNLKKMDFWIGNYGFGSVILFRISPFLSNDSISFIAGMLGMDLKKFIYATLCGMVPLTIAIAYFAEDPSKLKDGLYWIGGIGLVAYLIYILLDYKKRKRNSNSKS
ncbi:MULTISPECIES: TVP38/TMEM64 family protein [Salegentibacter]|uniref:TVP38/TMEM64 family membrane protein n=1 Tax=Salegentibacter agarivorans TaxID=345907 RepID=A0A1I2PFG6_9FLAO|nr:MULTISPECIES: VTT domain-containing protein [Salegentibacter]APS40197.1 hypothetical protein AO058_15500 [Salegentibacter sp. T436]SFG14270.1 Uncharacterized membrane protein YdjX, TVP38/TMEM64 family, SNARE-associated domain [Salegentibacter agarivorans]